MLRSAGESAASAQPTLPPLPEAPIFDAPGNPYISGLLGGASFPAFQGLSPDQIYHAQLQVIESVLHAIKTAAVNLSLTLMCVWLLMLVTCGLLLVRILRNRRAALRGDADAARKIVLPAFEPLLWLLCGVNLAYLAAYGVLLVSDDYLVYLTRVSVEVMYAGKQFNLLLVPVYLLQPSLSLRALGRAVGHTLAMSLYTVPVVWAMNTFGTRDQERAYYWTLIACRALVLVFFCVRFVSPPARASKQTYREFCAYVVTMMLLMYTTGETYHQNYVHTATALNWVITGYSMCLPVFVWRVLRADTEHWRGIGQRAVELQTTFRRKNARVDERVSSQGLHVLIEMHRKFIIDFAHLQLREPIGDSEGDEHSAIVYSGFLQTKKTPVAVKVYVPTDFTEETVAEFSHEAALCGALLHPNILTFHGLCVCPPNICLVTELCQGSLQEFKDAQAAQRRQHRNVPARRQQLLIDVGYMIDAARALAYLHSFSPPFVHRDIKPSNFLVDDEGTVKLTDFGASRTLAVRSTSGHQHQLNITAQEATTTRAGEEPQLQQQHSLSASTGRRVVEVPGVANSLTKQTAQYMAPEVIRAHHAGTATYAEAADVFSLAITMWDILHPGQAKYPLGTTNKSTSTFGRANYGHQRDSEVFELVFSGNRPPMDPRIHSGLSDLIQAAWHGDPRQRPTAQALVAALETIQEESCASFALELMDELNDRGRGVDVTATRDAPLSTQQTSFAGTQAVEKLRICDFVESQSEAIRLGNMLMDCGFLHHTKHLRSFEYGGSQYFFDEDHINLCQPLAIMDLEDESGGTSQLGVGKASATPSQRIHELHRQQRRRQQRSAGSSYHGVGACGRSGSHSSRVLMEHRCACRKLGQRVETERTTRRRFRRKLKLFTDETLLTANLLADDQQHNSGMEAAFSVLQDNPPRRPTGDAA